MTQEYPKMLYRAEGAEVKFFAVTDEASHEAAIKEGWGDRKAAVATAAKAPKPAPAAAKSEGSSKEALALISKLSAAEQALASKDEIIAAKDAVIEAQGVRIEATEKFLGELRADSTCPDALKDAISELLGDGEPEAPKGGKGKGKKA